MTTSKENSDSPSPISLEEQAKQLLALGAIVDNYPKVVERRILGLMYILIAGIVSLAGLTFTSFSIAVGPIASHVFVIVGFVAVVLVLSWGISFKLIVPLTRSYHQPSQQDAETSKIAQIVWIVSAISIIALTIYSFGTNQTFLFPIGLQLMLTIGNAGNYRQSMKNPSSAIFSKAQLAFALCIGLSIIPIWIFPDLAFTIMIFVDVGGIFGLGLYMLVSAEQLLLESLGRE
ncbi:MAG: hypothetical protein ACW976_06140 [Candidatus Ranarchaeia archaeon]|jgi:hypothetical protein